MSAQRVWLGCLGCYVDGRLIGDWYDAAEAPAGVAEITWTASMGTPSLDHGSHEELWVFDHDGFGGLLAGDCSPAEARSLAEVIARVTADGYPLDAFAAWRANDPSGDLAESADDFAEHFAGEWRDVEAYAYDLAEDLGSVPDDARWPLTCIDWTRAAWDLVLGGDIWTVQGSGGVYVFRAA
jgi:hypothetical protein